MTLRTIGGLLATLAMGPIITNFGPQTLYALAVVPLALILVSTAILLCIL